MTVDDLVDLLRRLAARESEPGLSELDHGLQCAWELAGLRPDDLELQVAGLCHDLGHPLGPDDEHGRLGGELLRPLMGERVAVLVTLHVTAKRYLAASEPGYRLSPGSVASLAAQGGALAPGEAAEFRKSRWFDDAVLLRRADDAAKVPGRRVPGLARWTAALHAAAVR